MKELTIEQKAQRYDEALEKAKDFHKGYKQRDNQLYTDDLESIFPELKESEDVCDYSTYFITYFKNAYGENSNARFAGVKIQDIIAWLEKQGTSYTKNDVDNAYLKGVTNTKNEIEKQYEADYQIRKDIATFIFNYKGDIKDRAKWIDYLGIKVYFVEKKELKKVEQKPTTMSLDEAIEHCEEKSCGNNACALEHKQLKKWLIELKELKERSLAWSEEDEKNYDTSLKIMCASNKSEKVINNLYDWFKSIRNRHTWKPTEEQLRELENVFSPYADSWDEDILRELYKQLKQL